MKELRFEKVISENIENLIGEKFGNYSKYIIQERALPDLRDGLKPVQRRILYAMNRLNLVYDSAYKKSARVVGDVIGKYHPHGDSSVYEAMVRLSQEWKINFPLIDMHGNKGSIDGDSAAAMRYTESRLSFFSQYLLENIDKKLVIFANNFDDSEKEPIVLPAQFPNILINGSTGIASGYSTNIPPHNFRETIDGLIYLFKNPTAKFSKIFNFIKGPDFPTGGIILGDKGIIEAYQTGKGKIIIRSKYFFDEKKKEIIINEIPFETNKAEIVRKISEIIEEDKISGIQEIRDDTDRNGLKITIKLKSAHNADAILEYLFKNTDLQKNFYINMIAIHEKKPILLNLMDILNNFKQFQIEIFTNLFQFELDKNQKKLEIIKALIIIVSDINKTVELIKSSKNKENAKLNLARVFNFSENQTEAIVNLKLYRLTSTDVIKLREDHNNLVEKITFYQKNLDNQEFLIKNIVLNLENIKGKIDFKRRTDIIKIHNSPSFADNEIFLEDKSVKLGISYDGYIKKISNLRVNKNKNKIDYKLRDTDELIFWKKVNNLEKLLLFTSKGKFYLFDIYKLPESTLEDMGNHISKFLSLTTDEKIIKLIHTKKLAPNLKIIIITKRGLAKQIDLSLFPLATTKHGIKFINLKNDEVVNINLLSYEEEQLIIFTKNGLVARYKIDLLPHEKLDVSSKKIISLKKDDYIVGAFTSLKSEIEVGNSQVFIISSLGNGKKFRTSEIKEESFMGTPINILKNNKIVNDTIFYGFELIDNLKFSILTEENKKVNFPFSSKKLLISDLKSGLNILNLTKIKAIFSPVELFEESFILNYSKNNLIKADKNKTYNLLEGEKEFDLDKILKDLDEQVS